MAAEEKTKVSRAVGSIIIRSLHSVSLWDAPQTLQVGPQIYHRAALPFDRPERMLLPIFFW